MALALLLAFGLLLAGFAGGWKLRGEHITLPKADTIRIERIDTVTLVENEIDTLIRIVYRPYPVAVHDTTLIVRHTTDSIFISLPYQYRYYGKPDTLDVWYSGVDARIDSARVYMRHTTEIIRQPYEVARMPRLTLDLGAGAAYNAELGMRNVEYVKAYGLAKLSLNMPHTTFSAFGAIDTKGEWGVGLNVSYRLNLVK